MPNHDFLGLDAAVGTDIGKIRMRSVDAGQFAANFDPISAKSLSEPIVVTKAGKPCAGVHGLDYDYEQMKLVNSPEWR